ncbi:MAG: 3-oxoacyl-ACP reductase FabG [Marinilabiliaceae bacterium]|nr:3-oxoacyl-ACP reductase FabG [Marinilabiliaceae bacterium]
MKYALVTGGSRGIGKAIVKKLAKQGFYVLINFQSNQNEANKVLGEVIENGGKAELLQFNVSDSEQVISVLGEWMKNNNRTIDVLVNNAGITRDNLMVFMTNEEWNEVVSVNQNSFFYVTKQVLEGMIINKYGRIINIVSLSGQKGHPGQVNYSAAKGAVIAATKSLAMEVGKKKVTVNCVAPGFINTEMTEHISEKDWKSYIPLNRFGTAEEVANVVGFLASDESSYITGETIAVNGGMYS